MQNYFNHTDWFSTCENLASEAARRAGLSDILYTRLISQSIEPQLELFNLSDRPEAERIARQFCYLNPEELANSRKEDAALGLCPHGLDPFHCPVGCGDKDN